MTPHTDRFSDQVAIVTGGSRGIGRATVEQMAREGAQVVFCGRDDTVGRAAEHDLAGLPVAFVSCDISRESDVKQLVSSCQTHFGHPTVLVNNAGVNANFDATTMTENDWNHFFDVDLKASWLLAKHVIPYFRHAGRGSIVNVSSIHAIQTLEGFFPYAAAKSGLVGLTRSLALDYGQHRIRVNCVLPGFTRTRLVQESIDRNPNPAEAEQAMTRGVALKRIATPDEIASVICFLASDDASYITGASLLVDGGLTARRSGA